jgi:Lon-like protease
VSAAPTGPPDHDRRRVRPLLVRYGFYSATLAIVAAAAFVVPLPFIEYVPGTPTPIPPLVEIEGAETTELDGETSLLTILLRQQPTVPALAAVIDGQRGLVPVTEVFRPGIDREDQLDAERQRFGRQFDVAAVVGARAAGIEADLVTEVVVFDVMPGSPADGNLTRGDVVLEADGNPIVAAEELQAITRDADPGDVLTLSIRHGGEPRDVEVELAEFGEDDEVRLGVVIETAVDEVRLPFDVTLAEGTRIGGPSAGMMVALTIYDLLSEEDLLAGRAVMGTGTVDADGRVGAVGGVPEKMRAAAAADADLVLVPQAQLEDALAAAPDDLEVAGVATFDDAVEVLRDTPGGS